MPLVKVFVKLALKNNNFHYEAMVVIIKSHYCDSQTLANVLLAVL